MSDDFEIESDIPVPATRMRKARTYPFADMEIGDSFAIPADVPHNRVRIAGYQFGRRHNRKYTVQRVNGERYRCWRVA